MDGAPFFFFQETEFESCICRRFIEVSLQNSSLRHSKKASVVVSKYSK